MRSPLVLFFANIYVVFAVIPETTEQFSCHEGPQVLKLKNASRGINCELSWTVHSTTIASLMGDSAECHNPCINVTADEIIISGCDNVTLHGICPQQVHVTEFRVHYQGIQKKSSAFHINQEGRHHYGVYASAVLLLVIFVTFCIQYYISGF